MSEGERLRLPENLMFPVEITKILVEPGSTITKYQPLLQYKFWNRAEDGFDEDGNQLYKTREFYGNFESPFDGNIKKVVVARGDRINGATSEVFHVEEACDHSVQYGGLCAICGIDLNQKDYTGYSATDRAPIAMSHGTQGLTVSRAEAEQLENASTKRLLADRKLILIVDLDQTVIHAAVDPQIGQWINDKSHPNHESVKDVKSFMLREQRKEGMVNCWYYIKLRPGLQDFLQRMHSKFEMHIYTMATKAYALEIAKILDPTGKYFGDRILGREESGSMVQKSLKRLFPVTTELVTIIDDRGDVWGWSSHLVRAVPYNFFHGTGDINSGLLPSRAGLVTPGSEDEEEKDTKLKDSDTELSALDKILTVVHSKFFDRVDAHKPADIGILLPELKQDVFSGCVFLLSGIIPLMVSLENADIVQWIRSFGALVVAQFVPSVTHVIADTPGTLKTRLAAGAGIPVVTTNWLFQCLREWKRVPIEGYTLKVSDPIRPEDAKTASEPNAPTGDQVDGQFNGGAVDWDELNKELEEFVDSSDDDDDDQGDEDDEEQLSEEAKKSLKRSREELDADSSPAPKKPIEDNDDGSDDDFAAELALSFA